MTNRKGTDFETPVAEFVSNNILQHVERRAKAGARDRGDLTPFGAAGLQVVTECKNCKRLAPSEWLRQAKVECQNAGGDLPVVVFKLRGKGEAHFGENAVLMELGTFCRLVKTANHRERCQLVETRWYGDEQEYQHELDCGHTMTTPDPEPPDFCPYCGAEVVG